MWQDQQGTAKRVRNNNSARADTPLDQRSKAPHMETKSPVILRGQHPHPILHTGRETGLQGSPN